MHKQYGPILRISPDQLHISDPFFYTKLFVTKAVRKTNLYDGFAKGTGLEDLVGACVEHDAHQSAIVGLKTFFSPAGFSRVEQRIVDRVRRLSGRLDAHAADKEFINLFNLMSSFTSDVISSIVFKEPSDLLGDPDYNEEWFTTLKYGLVTVPLLGSLPWLVRAIVMPALRGVPDKYTKWRLWDDFLQQAGSYNVAYVITSIIVYPSVNKDREKKLCGALAAICANTADDHIPRSKELGKIPCLFACIREGLSLMGGSMVRAAHVSPDCDRQYKQWTIPKGTPVPMLSYWMHMDGEIFDEPRVFRPERWLKSSREKLEETNTAFVPFSKGSRACFGQT